MPKALCKYTGAVIFLLIALLAAFPCQAQEEEPIDFPDDNLEEVIRIAINKTNGEPIYSSDLKKISALNASSRGITDLTYLDECKEIDTLQLYNNNITDISPLKNLPKLQDLYLWDNQVSDITPLANLANLRFVFLHNNNITDISPLMYNPSWGAGDILNVSGMYIDQYGLCYVLPELQWQGVVIYKDRLAMCNEGIRVEIPDPALEQKLRWALDRRDTFRYPDLLDTDLARLTFFVANDCGIQNLSGLEFCINLQSLSLNGNEITNIAPIARLSYLNTLMLASNNISDISPLSELYGLMELGLQDNNISDLTPLQALGGLISLYLNDNEISDVSRLQWLLNLRVLALDHNNLANIQPLSRLTELIQLRLNANLLTDLAALTPLVELKSLNLASNAIVDVAPLKGLVRLQLLDLSDNSIVKIDELATLWDLVALFLQDNQIQVISVLAGFPDLSMVTLANNDITDVSPIVANAGMGYSSIEYPYPPQYKDMVDVRGNELSLESVCNDIPALRLRNIIVKTDENQVCDPFAANYTLTMSVSGNTGGTTNPGAGSRRYVGGTRITISAEAFPGYVFSKWQGSIDSTEPTVEIIMDSDMNIEAVFAETSVQYTLTVEAVGSGSVDPTVGQHLYYSNSQATVKATASYGWVFDHWEGALTGSVNPQSVKMDADKLVRAVFVEQGPLQTLRIYVRGNGTTEPEPGVHQFPKDGFVTIQTIPDLGYKFDHWEGDLQGSAAQNVIQMTGPKSVTAVFVRDGYDHTLSIGVAEGGTTDPTPGYHRYYDEDVVTITAQPEDDYVFDYWSGAVNSTQNPLTVVMDSDKSLTAVFLYAPVRYSLSLGAMDGGTTSPGPGEYLYAAGKKVTVQAIPDEGYEFDHWEGDYAGMNTTVVVTMNGNIHMQAFFKPYPFLSGVTPGRGLTLGGDTVAVTGGRLDGATEVWFDDRPGTILWAGYDSISVLTPAHDRGVATIVVVTPDGETAPLIGAFEFVEPPGPPTFGEIIPAFGRVDGGENVLIRGQNLELAQTVLFGGEPATIISSAASRLWVETPAHQPGPVDIDITTTTGAVAGAAAFTYLPPPQITAISPNQGHAAGGDTVTISGADLAETFEVVFDADQAVIVSRTPTAVVVTAPPHSAGTVVVLLLTPGGQAIVENAYTYYGAGGAILCQVSNNKDLTPISDATVSLNTGASITNGPDGTYLFTDLRPGTYEVSITTADCEPESQLINVVSGQQATLNFMLDCQSGTNPNQCQSPVKRLNATIAEQTLPLSVQDAPTGSVDADSALAIRVTANEPIDPESVYAFVEGQDWTGAGGQWRPVDPEDGRDGWIVFKPEDPLPAGQTVTMTVGATTLEGDPVEPVKYGFAIRAGEAAESAEGAPNVYGATGIPELPGMLAAPSSAPYRIGPAQVFDAPSTILLPLPDGCSEDADIYYYSESVKHLGWHPAQNVEGFIQPNTRSLVEVDGQQYIQLQVNHGGVVQLGQTVRLKLGNTASVEIGYAGSRLALLAMLGTLAALALILNKIARKQTP